VVVEASTVIVQGVGNPLLAKATLGAVVGAPCFVGADADLLVFPDSAVGREENSIGGHEGPTASSHFDYNHYTIYIVVVVVSEFNSKAEEGRNERQYK
jgi:hypothetical protein